MTARRPILAICLALAVAAPASAADYSDPTWPCIQRKVTELSIGLVWPMPIEDTAERLDPEALHVAETLVLRRIDVEALRPMVEAFAAERNGDPAVLGQVFAHVFRTLDTRRSRVISGIEKFSLSQITLTEQIETARQEFSTLEAATTPDYARMTELEQKLNWDQLIFADRQQSIEFLCETPGLIERRLFAVAQILQEQIRDDG